jgi:hypothetical protein
MPAISKRNVKMSKKVIVIPLDRMQLFLSHMATSYYNSSETLKRDGHPGLAQTARENSVCGDVCVSLAKQLPSLSTEFEIFDTVPSKEHA